MRIIFNTSFITLNEYINKERSNKYAASVIKREMTDKVAYLAKAQTENIKKPIQRKIDIYFCWYTPNNKHDHDNISFAKKFILDGLVKAGVLVNDSPAYVDSFSDTFEVDKTRDYISCAIKIYEK